MILIVEDEFLINQDVADSFDVGAAIVPNAVASALTQDLGVRVVSGGQGSDAYWSSGTSGAQPLVIGEP